MEVMQGRIVVVMRPGLQVMYIKVHENTAMVHAVTVLMVKATLHHFHILNVTIM